MIDFFIQSGTITAELHSKLLVHKEAMMDLDGIEKALREGARLHGFRSGAGLRVFRIEKDGALVGYGEHPNANDALALANRDVLEGGIPYENMYGVRVPHYITGNMQTNSYIDYLIFNGHKLDAWFEKDTFHIRTKGFGNAPRRMVQKTGAGKTITEAIASLTRANYEDCEVLSK